MEYRINEGNIVAPISDKFLFHFIGAVKCDFDYGSNLNPEMWIFKKPEIGPM
jgi:hypothetical protein